MSTTAMQDMIKWVRANLPMDLDWPRMIEQKAESLLEKEKEQIIKAWNDGDYAYFYSKETGRDFANGEEYYNEKYNNE